MELGFPHPLRLETKQEAKAYGAAVSAFVKALVPRSFVETIATEKWFFWDKLDKEIEELYHSRHINQSEYSQWKSRWRFCLKKLAIKKPTKMEKVVLSSYLEKVGDAVERNAGYYVPPLPGLPKGEEVTKALAERYASDMKRFVDYFIVFDEWLPLTPVRTALFWNRLAETVVKLYEARRIPVGHLRNFRADRERCAGALLQKREKKLITDEVYLGVEGL